MDDLDDMFYFNEIVKKHPKFDQHKTNICYLLTHSYTMTPSDAPGKQAF